VEQDVVGPDICARLRRCRALPTDAERATFRRRAIVDGDPIAAEDVADAAVGDPE
jgi:hypothetical protein